MTNHEPEDVETGGELNHAEEVVPLSLPGQAGQGNIPAPPEVDDSMPEYPEQDEADG